MLPLAVFSRVPRPVCKTCWGVGSITLRRKQQFRELVRYLKTEVLCPGCHGKAWITR